MIKSRTGVFVQFVFSQKANFILDGSTQIAQMFCVSHEEKMCSFLLGYPLVAENRNHVVTE